MLAAERANLRKKQLAEQAKQEREQIEGMSGNQDEKDKLMRQHGKNTARLEEAIKKEQDKHHAAMMEKLAARRNKQLTADMARIKKEVVLGEESMKKRQVLESMEEESRQKPQTQEKVIDSGKQIKSNLFPKETFDL